MFYFDYKQVNYFEAFRTYNIKHNCKFNSEVLIKKTKNFSLYYTFSTNLSVLRIYYSLYTVVINKFNILRLYTFKERLTVYTAKTLFKRSYKAVKVYFKYSFKLKLTKNYNTVLQPFWFQVFS